MMAKMRKIKPRVGKHEKELEFSIYSKDEIATAVLENCWTGLNKTEHRHILWLNNFIFGYVPNRNVYLCILKDVHMNIHGSTI